MVTNALIYKCIVNYADEHGDDASLRLSYKELKDIITQQTKTNIQISNKDIDNAVGVLVKEGLMERTGKSVLHIKLLGDKHFNFIDDKDDLDIETKFIFEILDRKAFLGVAEINKELLENEIDIKDDEFATSIEKLVQNGYVSVLKEDDTDMQILVFDNNENKEVNQCDSAMQPQGLVESTLYGESDMQNVSNTELGAYLEKFDEAMDIVASCMDKALKAQEKVNLLLEVIENLRAEKLHLEEETIYLKNSNNRYRLEKLERI